MGSLGCFSNCLLHYCNINMKHEYITVQNGRPGIGLGTHLFVKVPRPGDSKGTLSVFESSCYLYSCSRSSILLVGQSIQRSIFKYTKFKVLIEKQGLILARLEIMRLHYVISTASLILAPFLHIFLDYSFNNGIFLNNCKIAKILPIHKKVMWTILIIIDLFPSSLNST